MSLTDLVSPAWIDSGVTDFIIFLETCKKFWEYLYYIWIFFYLCLNFFCWFPVMACRNLASVEIPSKVRMTRRKRTRTWKEGWGNPFKICESTGKTNKQTNHWWGRMYFKQWPGYFFSLHIGWQISLAKTKEKAENCCKRILAPFTPFHLT